jgi:uncharacterized protein YndB with AHSA1/START domain
MNTRQPIDKIGFKLVRAFNAPKKLVFEAFSTPEALNEWWGPVECRNSVVTLDFIAGGIFHFKMEAEWGTSYGRFLFKKIQPHDLLEFTNAFADEHANVVKAPFDMEFPKEIFYRITLAEQSGKTILTITGDPVNATAAELESFYAINDSMQQGFGGTFDKLDVFLGSVK